MRTILSAPAWPYANGPRHIGHVSGFALPCDMFSRYQRMAGHRVLMVSGTDEHGTPIQVQADAEGVTARELADIDPVGFAGTPPLVTGVVIGGVHSR
jgi:methionyl-tRNA synthetase